MVPQRPRLADHVAARQHVVGDDVFVLLHDRRTDRIHRIGSREWGILSAADGTRDVEGIRLAAVRLGAHARTEAIAAFLSELAAAKMLVDGPPQHDPERVLPRGYGHAGDARELEVLADFGFSCDCTGGCCGQYASVLMTPADAARARASLPDDDAGRVPLRRLLMPLRGSAPDPLRVVSSIDGFCAYLDPDGRCAIHRIGGFEAKPAACQAFPRQLCDDGTTVRVSVKPECACVLDDATMHDSPPLLPRSTRHVADLPATESIDVLPERVEIAHGLTVSREALRAWTDAIVRAEAWTDPAAQLWSLAKHLERGTLLAPARSDTSPPPAADVNARMLALREAVAARLRRDATWRSPVDRVLRTLRWIVVTARAIEPVDVLAEVLAMPAVLPTERRYVRAIAFAYAWVDDRPLADRLRDRAIRLWLSRALPTFAAVVGATDRSFRHPLAAIEPLLRAHGLQADIDDRIARS